MTPEDIGMVFNIAASERAAKQKSVNDVISNLYKEAQIEKIEMDLILDPYKAGAEVAGRALNSDIRSFNKYKYEGGKKSFEEWYVTDRRAGPTTVINVGDQSEKRAIGAELGQAKGEDLSGQTRLQVMEDLDLKYLHKTMPSGERWENLPPEVRNSYYFDEYEKRVLSRAGNEGAVYKTLKSGTSGWFVRRGGQWELVAIWSD